jgi:hypothetical protein
MWLAHYLSSKKPMNKLLIVSFFVYLCVNMFENLIHYTIGKHSEDKNTDSILPPLNDWIRIILVMIVFAALQGALTCYFTKKC